MLSKACPNNMDHFLHPSQRYCKECGADAVVMDHYTCQCCGWVTWNPVAHATCPQCGSAVFEPVLAVSRLRLA